MKRTMKDQQQLKCLSLRIISGLQLLIYQHQYFVILLQYVVISSTCPANEYGTEQISIASYTCSVSALLQTCTQKSSLEECTSALSLSNSSSGSTDVWSQLADLPVPESTCVTFCGQLLAIGGIDSDYKSTASAVYMILAW